MAAKEPVEKKLSFTAQKLFFDASPVVHADGGIADIQRYVTEVEESLGIARAVFEECREKYEHKLVSKDYLYRDPVTRTITLYPESLRSTLVKRVSVRLLGFSFLFAFPILFGVPFMAFFTGPPALLLMCTALITARDDQNAFQSYVTAKTELEAVAGEHQKVTAEVGIRSRQADRMALSGLLKLVPKMNQVAEAVAECERDARVNLDVSETRSHIRKIRELTEGVCGIDDGLFEMRELLSQAGEGESWSEVRELQSLLAKDERRRSRLIGQRAEEIEELEASLDDLLAAADSSVLQMKMTEYIALRRASED